jgi:carbonic anhydrase/acetyltransferase-like protein (isoleucine patch superfamily)
MGSVIPDGVKVNSDCLIGARTFIEFGTEIPPGSLVLGAPAKVVGPISAEHRKQIVEGRAIYQELTRRCLKSFREIPHPLQGKEHD